MHTTVDTSLEVAGSAGILAGVHVVCVCGLEAEEEGHRRKGLQHPGHWFVVQGIELSKKVHSSGVPSSMLT